MQTPPLGLLIPTLSLLFATAFLALWGVRRDRRHLLLFGLSYLAFSGAMAVQMLDIPAAEGPNALISGLLYTAGALLLIEGCFGRIGRRPERAALLVIALGVMIGLGWFYYGDPRIVVRVYIQNFGYGLILTIGALQLGAKGGGKPIDRVIFWMLLLFGLHFFPRTILSVDPFALTAGRAGFAGSAFWISLVFSLMLFTAGLALTLLAAAAADQIDDIRQQGDRDGLTGLLNRRAFEREAARHLAEPAHQPLCLIACDIDQFKRINDTWGHQAGDEVIRTFSALLAANIRGGDIAGRIGGEEFGLLLPKCSGANAHRLAERIRSAFERTPFLFGDARVFVTASFGVVGQQTNESLFALAGRADALLYAAKGDGRNRTASDRPPDNVLYVDPLAWSGGRH
jgi:diguanylate cyclase (GGDEF)-like protein